MTPVLADGFSHVVPGKRLPFCPLSEHLYLPNDSTWVFEMFLTDKRRSDNHGVLVVGQLGDAVCVLGGAEVEDIPHVFALVAHGFGSWTERKHVLRLLVPGGGGDARSRDLTHLLPVATNSFL